MASAQVVETSVNTNNSPSQDYTTNPDDHSNHNSSQIVGWNMTVLLFPMRIAEDLWLHMTSSKAKKSYS